MSAVVKSVGSTEMRSSASITDTSFDSGLPLVTGSRLNVTAIRRKEVTSLRHSSNKRIVFVNRYFYPDVPAMSKMLDGLTSRLAQQRMHVRVGARSNFTMIRTLGLPLMKSSKAFKFIVPGL